MDLNDSTEQQIDLAFNQDELTDLALPITPSKEMRATG